MQNTILVCSTCLRSLRSDPKIQVEELENDCGCNCTEIQLELYEPTPCGNCRNPRMAGCPMHLNVVKISPSEE